MSLAHVRNLETGEIKVVETEDPEFSKLKEERYEHGRFPLYEQTGAHDADPKQFAAEEEVQLRSRWNVPIEDVTADGVGISIKAKEKLGEIEADRQAKERGESRSTKAKASS